MKVLFPAITCLLTSNLKPTLGDAISSVLAQTRKDFQLLVVDSGQWIDRTGDVEDAIKAAYDEYSGHPLVEWITTGEGPDLVYEACPVAYVTNQVIRAGLIRGEFMNTFYDDDLLKPDFFEKMAGFLDENPEADVVFCSEERVKLTPDGDHWPVIPNHIMALNSKTSCFDCVIDGAQVMWRSNVLDNMEDPWLPESPSLLSCRHSDGIFLENLMAATRDGTMHNIDEVLVTHRITSHSTYQRPYGSVWQKHPRVGRVRQEDPGRQNDTIAVAPDVA
jgi:glycosyltransferase involved in cell wall biosynthesis